MTREAIEYFKFYRKIFCDDYLKICPKDSIAYQATLKEKEYYDEAIKALEQEYEDIAKAFQLGLAFGFGEKHDEMNRVIDEIKKVIEPQPKTGHWVEYKPGHHRCSNCNKEALVKWHNAKKDNVDILTNYCPNCGRYMVKSQEREGKECR